MRLAFAAALVALALPLPATAQRWVRIAEGDKTRSYIDLDSVKKGEFVRLDSLTVLVQPRPDSPTRAFVSTIDYDCKTRRGRFALMVSYDRDRNELQRYDYTDPADFREPRAGSDAEKIYEFACEVTPAKGVPVADPWTDQPPAKDQ